MALELIRQLYDVALFAIGCILSYHLGKEVAYGNLLEETILKLNKDKEENMESEEEK